jgi:hypothetical protein
MWNDSSETLVAVSGQVSVAPIGTALPTTTLGALNAAFVGLGFTTDDGVSFSVSRETTDIGAWQSFDPIRTLLTARAIQMTFSPQQWNENTVPLAFGGGSISGSTPNFKYTPPSPEEGLDERALVLDLVDGDVNTRLVFPRGIVIDSVETTFSKGATAVLPITFKALTPESGSIFELYSNSPGFTAGS